MSDNNFNFHFPLQIRWNDLDALGHVNNAIFVTYFEIARGHFMITACPQWDWSKDMFLIGNINIDYRKELFLTTNTPIVSIRTQKLGTKSFILEYAITSTNNGETILHATGSTTQIMFDLGARTTIFIPDWVREALSTYDQIPTGH